MYTVPYLEIYVMRSEVRNCALVSTVYACLHGWEDIERYGWRQWESEMRKSRPAYSYDFCGQ